MTPCIFYLIIFNKKIRNKIIHIICIPLIAATLFYLLGCIPYHLNLDNVPLIGSIKIGAAEILGAIGTFY